MQLIRVTPRTVFHRSGELGQLDQAELGGLDQTTRDLDLAALDLDGLQGDVVGLPLRTPGAGVGAGKTALRNCQCSLAS